MWTTRVGHFLASTCSVNKSWRRSAFFFWKQMIHPCQTLNPITLPRLRKKTKLKNLLHQMIPERPFRFKFSINPYILETLQHHSFPLMNPRVFWRCVSGTPTSWQRWNNPRVSHGPKPTGFFGINMSCRASRALCWMLRSPSRLCSIDPWMMGRALGAIGAKRI